MSRSKSASKIMKISKITNFIINGGGKVVFINLLCYQIMCRHILYYGHILRCFPKSEKKWKRNLVLFDMNNIKDKNLIKPTIVQYSRQYPLGHVESLCKLHWRSLPYVHQSVQLLQKIDWYKNKIRVSDVVSMNEMNDWNQVWSKSGHTGDFNLLYSN